MIIYDSILVEFFLWFEWIEVVFSWFSKPTRKVMSLMCSQSLTESGTI